eukprot:7385975-Prymnesium_polylepis.1
MRYIESASQPYRLHPYQVFIGGEATPGKRGTMSIGDCVLLARVETEELDPHSSGLPKIALARDRPTGNGGSCSIRSYFQLASSVATYGAIWRRASETAVSPGSRCLHWSHATSAGSDGGGDGKNPNSCPVAMSDH